MRILITSHRFYPDLGGIETISEILASFLVRSGHSVRLVTQSEYHNPTLDVSFPFETLRCPGPLKLLTSYRWADLVFQNNIEIRQLWPYLFIRKPLVIGLQTWIRSIKGKRNAVHNIKLAALNAADAVIACSNSVRTDSYPYATVIGNPFNQLLFKDRPEIQRHRSIAFLGRLVSDKGTDLLLHAYASLRRPDWPLTIIGSGPELDALRHLATSLGIRNSVRFLGSLQGEPLAKTLNAHEILVVPSLWEEPFGVVALEGLASGCVVLASDGGGLPDAVGLAGILFKRGNQADLSRQLLRLLDDKNLRKALKAHAPHHLSHFQHNVVCSRYLEIFERVYRQSLT